MSDQAINTIFFVVVFIILAGGIILFFRSLKNGKEEVGHTPAEPVQRQAKLKKDDVLGKVAAVEEAHREEKKDKERFDNEKHHHEEYARKGLYNSKPLTKEQKQGLIVLGIVILVVSVILYLGVYLPAKKALGYESKPLTVNPSGQQVPMGQQFLLGPEANTNLDLRETAVFDGQAGRKPEKIECKNNKFNYYIDKSGPLFLSNVNGGKVIVTTPPTFPGMVTFQCKGDQLILISQTTE